MALKTLAAAACSSRWAHGLPACVSEMVLWL